MSFPMEILLVFVFLAVSTVFSMLGQGGGAFYVPMLLAVSVPFYVAASTSQVLIVVVSLSSLLIFARHGMQTFFPPAMRPYFSTTVSPHRSQTNDANVSEGFLPFIGNGLPTVRIASSGASITIRTGSVASGHFNLPFAIDCFCISRKLHEE